jgi:hypothetical protein
MKSSQEGENITGKLENRPQRQPTPVVLDNYKKYHRKKEGDWLEGRKMGQSESWMMIYAHQ